MSSLSELKIKTNVVKRLSKEEQCYLKEVASLKEKLEEYKTKADYDEYEANQMQRVIEDTEQILPDCRKRLLSASNNLSDLVKSDLGDGSEKTQTEISEAKTLLQSLAN